MSKNIEKTPSDLSVSKLHFQFKPEELNQSLRSIFNKIAFTIHISEGFESK